uniref:Uncharacterized protein n=1 Tax=uncultured Armatimonadetes bacterium TaxID=157466 RepID=A0A6J4J4J9_9BACT|nr:hypothetical protein AVDCRST_MAG63-2826 [uncultured Armatimonadetes bacterium]
MRDPMLLDGADDPRLIWIGYPDVAGVDRFAVPDEAAGIVYLYIPLDLACRWDAAGTADGRTLHLRFRTTPEDDARLARARERYSRRAAAALDLWDHAPRGRKS